MATNSNIPLLSPGKKNDFGKFKIRLAKSLGLRDVMTLSTYFNLAKADIDKISRSDNPGLDLVLTLESEAVISDTDISQLVEGLRECDLGGVVDKIQSENPGILSSPRISEEAAPILDEITFIRREDSLEQQKSTIQSLNSASKNQSVTRLTLNKTFLRADHDEIVLENGLRIPLLACIKELNIVTEKGREFNEQEMIDLITCCQRRRKVKKLLFTDAVLPLSVNSISSITTMGELEVAWQLMNHEYHLHFASGTWNLTYHGSTNLTGEQRQKLSKILSTGVILRKSESKLGLCNKMLLLENASKNKIPISCLVLDKLLVKADQNEISFTSGVRVLSLATLEKLEVISEKETNLSQDDVLGVMKYVRSCHRMNKVTFSGCLLPFSFDVKALSSVYNEKSMAVFWRELDQEFRLDRSSGNWIIKDSEDILGLALKGHQNLRNMCQKTTYLRKTDSNEFQRSTILLLEIASNYSIPIAELNLRRSFRGFDGDNIRLESGLCISSLSSVEKISINGDGNQQISEEEEAGLLNFGMKSTRFKELWFFNCKLPPSINPASITEEAKRRNVKVLSSNEAKHLVMENGIWKEPEDIETIKSMCSSQLTIDNSTSESAQRSVIELLVKATSHDIPIFRVYLGFSFDKINEDGLNIILKSGLLLPNISSMERMTIRTKKGREMKEEEVNGILNYLQQNKRLKTLKLSDCTLPSPISLGSSASTLRSRNVKVIWMPDVHKREQSYRLDLGSGHFEIPISELNLEWSFRGFKGDNIKLESGLCISSLSSVEKISINGDGKQQISEEEVTGLINFGMKSTRFKELWFLNCKLPPSINPVFITEEAKRRNAKVLSSNEPKYLAMENGIWKEPKDIETIKSLCSYQ